ncbi:murein L,D-transpeptidase [Rhizobium sp. KVB221]|uniref:Murein L,D-transpeptidase n=2 Tax=Rhizobium setariae TaxID=2801340 RepID=A0A936YRS1_9HYPH|nr:murein L,D-transpeptidase [Rhizobium setariae]
MRVAYTGFAFALALGVLAGCTQETLQIESVSNRIEHPLPAKMRDKLRKMNLAMSSPIMMRIFKEEEVLEIWKANASDRYQLVATYPICAWSGMLGPKKKEGDRQAPEGFYTINQHQMNPNSSYYLSFDIGYPNKYDRAYGRTGSNLMVHGACSSAGCYSMSDAAVLQIYAFAREAFRGGQKNFQVQAYPFRMTAENMAKHRSSEHYEFWKNIKTGYDYFEITHRPPEVDVCNKQYAFNQVGGACSNRTPPALASAYASYSKSYEMAFATASTKFGSDSWKDTPEFERKAAERLARRMGKQKKVPNDADYVLVDPNAKITPTSDTVTSYSAAYAKVEAIKNGTYRPVEYLSVAEVEARKKIEEEKRLEAEKLAKQLAKANIPVPETNPLKPAIATNDVKVVDQGEVDTKPFWHLWKRDEPAAQPAQAMATEGQPDTTEKKVPTAGTVGVETGKPETQTVTSAEPVRPVDQGKVDTKPFWKVW